MKFNPDWPFWIESSVMRHMASRLAAAGYTLRTALEDEPPPGNKYIQVLLDGPEVQNPSGSCYSARITIVCLIEFKVTSNIYETSKAVGACMAMLESIPIYSTQEQVGCLIPIGAPSTRDWGGRDGGVANKLGIHQRTVEATLEIILN